MSNNASTGNESTAGPMGPIEQHPVDCPDCDFSESCSTAWAAESVALSNAGETGHDLPEAFR